jgi:hypothetical protein
MTRMIKSPRLLALAALAAMLALWVPQASAGSQAVPAATGAAAHSAGQKAGKLTAIPWIRHAIASAGSQVTRPKVNIGDFSQCPALPPGFDPAAFSCFLIHITGGQLLIGHANQVISKTINVAYAQGADPQGNTVIVFGSLKTQPMPVLGGIFLTPQVDSITQTDPNLKLSVLPVGLGAVPDFTGQTPVILSMRVKALNPVFGNSCSVGSRRHPVTVDPTFGTTNPPPPNQPISGHVDSVQQIGNELVIIGTVVDNAFAAPSAQGCGPSGVLSTVVNEVGALPSPAGTNTAIFQVTVEVEPYPDI